MTTKPLVLIVRDPDASNDVTVFGGDVETHDMDLGYANLDDPNEFIEWYHSHLHAAATYREQGYGDAADAIENVAINRCPDKHWILVAEGGGWPTAAVGPIPGMELTEELIEKSKHWQSWGTPSTDPRDLPVELPELAMLDKLVFG